MHFDKFAFGSIQIDGSSYEHDVVIDRGQVRKRKKKPSKKFRDTSGHTPVSQEEAIPWKCRQLVIGTGTGALPVMDEVKQEAKRRKIKLVILPTKEAIQELKQESNLARAGQFPCPAFEPYRFDADKVSPTQPCSFFVNVSRQFRNC